MALYRSWRFSLRSAVTNWMHMRGNHIDMRSAMKQQIRNAFYVDRSWWHAAIYGRSADLVLRSARAFSQIKGTRSLRHSLWDPAQILRTVFGAATNKTTRLSMK